MATATRPTAPAPNPYADLLCRYVAGDIAEHTFGALCDTMDEAAATADERLAFARFYLDALAAGETDAVLPRPEEIADVLTIARA